MKKLAIICAFMLGIVSLSKAQNRKMPTPEERAKRNTDMLASKLNLSDDQKTKVMAINMEQAARVDSLMKASTDMKANRSVIKGIRQETNAKIKAVLTADQKKQYEAWQEEMKSKMQNRQGGGAPRPAGQAEEN